MAKLFNPSVVASVKTSISIAPAEKSTANYEFLVRRAARSHRRARRAF